MTRKKSFRSFASFLVALFAFIGSARAVDISDVEQRVDKILSQMTLEEKIDYISATGNGTKPIPRLNIPVLKISNGPLGVGRGGGVSNEPSIAYPGGIALAATWNTALAERMGKQIGRDARARGIHIVFAPAVDIYRAPLHGYSHQHFGEDPFLVTRIAVAFIENLEKEGVSATIKHFIGNNSEFARHTSDSIIDERTLREIYLPPYEAAVKEANVGMVMGAYNLTNGEYMSQNGRLNIDVLKKEWGFAGILFPDNGGTHDGVAAANGGLDWEWSAGLFMNQANLVPAIRAGKVSVATIDDKVRRILRTAIRFGWFDRDQTDLSIPRYNLEGREVALQGAREGMVLLKNDGNILPLNKSKIRSIAVIGPDAYPAQPGGGGAAQVRPFAAVSFLEGIGNALGTSAKVFYDPGIPTLDELANVTEFSTDEAGTKRGITQQIFDSADLSGTPSGTRVDLHVNLGGAAGLAAIPQGNSRRWSGYYTASTAGNHDLFVQFIGRFRLYIDDKLTIDNWEIPRAYVNPTVLSLTAGAHKVRLEMITTPGRGGYPVYTSRYGIKLGIASRESGLVSPSAKEMARNADAVVLAVGFNADIEGESRDLAYSLPPGQDALIQAIAGVNKNVIVVVTSGVGVNMSGWLDKIPALLQAWYPGQEGGTALAEILLGSVNPSGRLPITIERRLEDNPAYANYFTEPGTNRIVYKEGVFVGYRGYDRRGTKPLFPFGYGLSYSTFKFANLNVTPSSFTGNEPVTVSFDVTNTGRIEGQEVAQLYVHDTHSKVERPEKELKGFVKISLKPRETKRASIRLDRRAFSYYDVNSKQWIAEPGDFGLFVSSSAEQVELRGIVTLTR
jgi:beta-glucosidase